jgi:DNA-binding transcriptional regulator YhcF (GntR family)
MSKFTQIPNWYWECGLDIYEVNILARIASWQRDKKDFFESYPSLANRFNLHVNTIKNKFKKLEKLGLITRNGKAGRSIRWKVDEYQLNQLHKEYKRCTNIDQTADKYKTCTNIAQKVQEIDYNSTPDRLYNTNYKTSNKTSFMVDESLADSPPREEEIQAFANDLDI